MKKTILILLTGTLFFTSCSKSVDTPEENQLNFNEEDLAYVQMQPGKYFIYKDSATGDTDSVVVTKSKLESQFAPAIPGDLLHPASPSYNYQIFTLLLSKVTDISSKDWFYGVANSYTNTNIQNPATFKNKSDLWLHGMDRLSNYESLGYAFSPNFSSPILNGNKLTIPNITIEGKNYTDVRQIFSSSPFNTKKLIYYWAKGMGIIKKSVTTGNTTQTWTLVRNG